MAHTPESNANPRVPGVDFIVSRDELERAGINEMLADFESVDCHDINRRFHDRAQELEPDKAAPLQLLAGLTYYHVVPDHRTEPFRPMIVMGGRRSLVPTDFLQDQIEVLADIAPKIKNPGLSGRMADVVWFIQRRRQNMAELAIESYCDCIELVRNGNATFAFGDRSPLSIHAHELAVRAARISHATGWRLRASQRLRALIVDLVSIAYEQGQGNAYNRMVEVAIDHNMTPCDRLAAQAEDLARRDDYANNPDARMSLWIIAARCHRLCRDDENHKRCMVEVAECYVQKADLTDSPMLESAFLQDAIQTLRNHPGTRERRDALTARLREVQPSIPDEMGSFSTEVDLMKIVEHSVASVRGRSWPTAFLSLILCDRPPTPEEIRQVAEQHARDSPLHGMMPMHVHDYQGRLVFRSPGLGGGVEPEEEHLRYLMAFHRGHARQIAVAGAIRPICRTVAEEHPVSADVVRELIEDSPFIPPGHSYIFARAIVQFLGGEAVEAVSLLVPQLENSLRHLLSLRGIDTTTADESGIQTEASLSVLLNARNPWRAQLEEMIPPRYIHEIDLLFNFAGGPLIRNQLAHGKVPAGGFWDHDFVYAAWLVIHLAVLPLARRWGEIEETFVRVTGLGRS